MRLLILALVMGLGSFSFAHGFHSQQVCDSAQKNLCLHLGYGEIPELEKEFNFVVHLVAPDNSLKQVRSVKVDLWMDMGGHGHSSAPVQIQRLSADHFAVTEAFFVMKGEWQIRIQVLTTTTKYDFIVPIEVRK